MVAVLEKFGFVPNFIHWIRTLYNGAESNVMNNSHSTGFFPLERGTRQGDPISAYLFIIALEVLFRQVRQNIDIQGFMIDGHEIKISAYADDAKFLTIKVHSMELVLHYYYYIISITTLLVLHYYYSSTNYIIYSSLV